MRTSQTLFKLTSFNKLLSACSVPFEDKTGWFKVLQHIHSIFEKQEPQHTVISECYQNTQ